MSDRTFSVAMAGALVLALGCSAGVKQTSGAAGATGTGGTATAGSAGAGGVTGSGGSVTPIGTAGSTGAGGATACVPSVTCTPAGGRYCNVIGNGCKGGMLDCGACPGDATCSGGATNPGICIGGASCMAITCQSGGAAKYCGTIGDGCGRALDCGSCAAGQVCNGGLCVPAGCTPLTCSIAGGGQYCGTIGDGCGGSLDCMGCGAPMTCGGASVQGVCGTPAASCTNRLNCKPTGGQYCGVVGDNCGGSIDCGACDNGMACGTNHVCPSSGPGPCTNLQCQLDKPGECTGNGTTISGMVYDPAGKTPLYNVLLYVPNTALAPIPTGASCDRCDSPISGTPVAAGLSDATGHFVIKNAPSGTNVPLVIQIGKWRRKIILPTVTKCQDNAFSDPNTVRLPRSMNDRAAGDAPGDVHMPLIALSTGHADALDCLLRKIGIADSEFTTDSGTGRVHMYVGGAGNMSNEGSATLASGGSLSGSYTTLFPNIGKMLGYDVLILQCESGQLTSAKDPYLGNMKRYADSGGRIFVEHLHSYWIRAGLPPWPATANWATSIQDDLTQPGMSINVTVDTSFPKGIAMADWLQATGASTTRGVFPVFEAQNSVFEVYGTTRRWIYTTSPATTQYLTFNTPVEARAENQCGRVVFTDVHVGTASGDSSDPAKPFPTACAAPIPALSPQAKAIEFMFFDLSSCVQIDTGTPTTPPIPLPGMAPTPPPIPTAAPPAPPPPPPPPPPPNPG
jgi:hypothetical protein